MAREDWQDREDERRRREMRAREDYGQADYSTDYAYDPERRGGYPRSPAPDREYGRRMDSGDYRPENPPRSWMDGARDFLTPAPRESRPDTRADLRREPRVETRSERTRRGPSDRVLWAVIVERLKDERGLDLRDLEVIVEDAEVTLNGTVRHKADKRRIEDVADVDGIRHVQNNLRLRDHRHWTFF